MGGGERGESSRGERTWRPGEFTMMTGSSTSELRGERNLENGGEKYRFLSTDDEDAVVTGV